MSEILDDMYSKLEWTNFISSDTKSVKVVPLKASVQRINLDDATRCTS